MLSESLVSSYIPETEISRKKLDTVTYSFAASSPACEFTKCDYHLCKHKLFLKIILSITHSACLANMEAWRKGSDLIYGHRVFPGKGGHKFTGPPALASSVSFNMSPH